MIGLKPSDQISVITDYSIKRKVLRVMNSYTPTSRKKGKMLKD